MNRTRHPPTQNEEFFTNPILAQELVGLLDKHIGLSRFDAFVEPSAGAGAFVDAITQYFTDKRRTRKPVFAYDIQPRHPRVKRRDFLTLRNPVPGNVSRDAVLCIGNPPFGDRAKLAGKFIQRCAAFSDHIAFVLPIGFVQAHVQKRMVPAGFQAVFTKVLRNTQFLTADGSVRSVNVTFVYFKNTGKDPIRLSVSGTRCLSNRLAYQCF